jgi:peptidoglycan hydrolase-like protein with peptidoglycan-binding domain
MAMRSSRRSTRRMSGGSKTRRTRMSHKMGKHGHRAAWIAGTAVGAAAIVAAVLLLKNKNAAAATPPPGVLPPSGGGPTTPLQTAAVAMNDDMNANGYLQTSMPVYKAFQTAAGLTADGYPGTNTYNALLAALASINPPVTPSSNWNPAYTFAAATGWDGVHAPTESVWYANSGTAPASGWPAAGS